VVNVGDYIYQIRNGTGVGVFASQYGPRRAYYFGISQKLGAPEKTPGVLPGFYTKTPTPAATVYYWGGPYVGANFGGAFSSGEHVITPIGWGSTNPSGVLGGLQFGYNYLAAPSWLIGIEGELGWASAQGKANFVDPTASLSITSDQNWYDTVTAKVGYVMGPLMLFGKGGAAWMNADYNMQVNSGLSGLTVSCRGKRTELSLRLMGDVNVPRFGEIRIDSQIGDRRPVKQRWIWDEQGTILIYQDDPVALLQSIPEGARLRLGLGDSNGARHMATYQLFGLDVVRKKVANACAWPPSSAQASSEEQ